MRKDWQKLKTNNCPVCNNRINRSGQADYDCFNCGFYCKLEKAQEILLDIEIKNIDKKTDDWLSKNRR